MHDLNEATKRVVDVSSITLTGAAAGLGALTLADWALVITIIAGALSIAWQILRFYDRFRYGRRTAE